MVLRRAKQERTLSILALAHKFTSHCATFFRIIIIICVRIAAVESSTYVGKSYFPPTNHLHPLCGVIALKGGCTFDDCSILSN